MTKLNHSFLFPVIIENEDQCELKKESLNAKTWNPTSSKQWHRGFRGKDNLVSMKMESPEVTVVKGVPSPYRRFTGKFKQRRLWRQKVCRSFFQYRKDKKVIT